VLALVALVEERELEERAHVGALGGERDEDGDVGGVVLGVLPVGVEVDRPLVPAHGEGLAGDVLPHAHALGERVALDHEPVRAVHRLRHRPRARRRRRHVPRQVFRRRGNVRRGGLAPVAWTSVFVLHGRGGSGGGKARVWCGKLLGPARSGRGGREGW
jgi:hypothetical protein